MQSDDLRKAFDLSQPDFPKGSPVWYHPCFHNSLACLSNGKDELSEYLPSNISTKVFDKQAEIESLWSSYKDHGYGFLFYALTRMLKPDVCVEIGVLHGFSLLTAACALRDNDKGIIHGFDLFEKYPYRHDKYVNLIERVENMNLQKWVTASVEDAFEVHKRFDVSIDYLHVDISNNGDTYRRIFEQWNRKVNKIILFEGGSSARDKVEWMIKYEKPQITTAIEEIRNKYPEWNICVLDPYPSMAIAVRK